MVYFNNEQVTWIMMMSLHLRYIDMYGHNNNAINNYLVTCIEKFEAMNDMKAMSNTILAFIQRLVLHNFMWCHNCIIEEILWYNSVMVQKAMCQYFNYCTTQLLSCWQHLGDCRRKNWRSLKVFIILFTEECFGVRNVICMYVCMLCIELLIF